MSFWSEMVSRFRGIFRRGRIPPPLIPPVPQILRKNYLIVVSGHVIYTPMKKAKFKIGGVATLDMFLAFAEEMGLEQGRDRRGKGEHPLAVEMVAKYSLDHPITDKSLEYRYTREVLKMAISGTDPSIAGEIEDFMVWGVEYVPTDEEEDFEAIKRMSRDGEDFDEYDISRWVKSRLLGKI